MYDEIWIDCYKYGNTYQVSNLGNVRKKIPQRDVSNSKFKDGYRYLKKQINIYEYVYLFGERNAVHRIVFQSFVCKIKEGYEIDHIDGNPLNNRIDNLRMTTKQENRNNPVTVMRLKKLGLYRKSVCQYTIDGELLSIYPSIYEAAKIIGKDRQGIYNCCRGNQKTAYGFVWRYNADCI